MTALQKFLKQIVLKQVNGSVYLVPAICDFQIEEALEEERKQGQNLPISNVSDSHFTEFCCHVTGHDEATISQMYEDWKRYR